MQIVGAYEAKTHLPQLLRSVAEGETIIITNKGVRVAQLCPVETHYSISTIIQDMKNARRNFTLGEDLDIREMRDEGRA